MWLEKTVTDGTLGLFTGGRGHLIEEWVGSIKPDHLIILDNVSTIVGTEWCQVDQYRSDWKI